MAEFQFLINGELITYDKYEDIPETFDHVIKFLPDEPEPAGEDGGHTEEQHKELSLWNGRLQELIKREGK
ncbi:MAG: hypothetical protein ACKVG0_14955 [Alphaproteobacteria bacterium]